MDEYGDQEDENDIEVADQQVQQLMNAQRRHQGQDPRRNQQMQG